MVGPQLGRETDAIAESAYKIERRLCIDYTARDIIIRSAGKVVRPKPDQPDRRRRLCFITESVDSVRRDTTYTQYIPIQKKSPQISETVHLLRFITTYRSSLSVFMTNKTPHIAKNRRERTTHGTRKTGKLFFFLLLLQTG